MGLKKLSDTEKVRRAKNEILRALKEAKENSNRAEALGSITQSLAYSYAILDADKDDSNKILFVAASIANEVQKVEVKPLFPSAGKQLELPQGGKDGKQKN